MLSLFAQHGRLTLTSEPQVYPNNSWVQMHQLTNAPTHYSGVRCCFYAYTFILHLLEISWHQVLGQALEF